MRAWPSASSFAALSILLCACHSGSASTDGNTHFIEAGAADTGSTPKDAGAGGARGEDASDEPTDAGAGGAVSVVEAGARDGRSLGEWAPVNAENNPFPCENAVPAAGFGFGFVACDSGLIIRPLAVTCPRTAGPATDECLRDDECGSGFCRCATGPGVMNYCAGASGDDCRSDADCATGFHCGHVIIGFSDWAIWHMRCQTPKDECAAEKDCPAGSTDAGPSPLGSACQADAVGRLCCNPNTVGCGPRP